MTGSWPRVPVLPRLVLALAVALLPVAARDRYREEWAADVDGAAHLGLSPSRVAFGALVGAVRLTTAPGGPVPGHPGGRRTDRGFVPAAVGGCVVGTVVGVVLAFAGVVLAGSLFADEQQQEGTLVVGHLAGALLGAVAGRTTALRLVGHVPSRPLVPVVLGVVGAVGSLYLLGAVVPPDVLNAYGALLLPVTLVLCLAGSATAGEALAAWRSTWRR